ncbi:MAG: 50S ribosomal protein L10 [Nanoarchaeota archaeon]|nr:50S ribosomal protein L10 [Nanoarchaeota archaeon]
MTILTKKLPEWKAKKVDEIASKMKGSKTIGIVDIHSLPAREFHSLRSKLRNNMHIEVVKKSILQFAIEKVKNELKDIEKLEEYLNGMPALILSQLDPFKLSKIFSENKAPAFAKPGQIAPEDIVIKAGPTPFAPGPMLSELKSKGLKVKIEAGKITIQEDAVVVKKGEEISEDVADLLIKLGIKPMEIGLAFSGAWEDGYVFSGDVLSFNAEEYIAELERAANEAFRLSIGLPYPTRENISLLISKAYNEAKTLARERDIFVEELAGEMLAKAEAQASELSNYVEEHKKE